MGHVHNWKLEPAMEVSPTLWAHEWRGERDGKLMWAPGRQGDVPATCPGCRATRLFHPFTSQPDPLAVLAA